MWKIDTAFAVCGWRDDFLLCVRWSKTALALGFRGFVRLLKKRSCSLFQLQPLNAALNDSYPVKVTGENKICHLKNQGGSRTIALLHSFIFESKGLGVQREKTDMVYFWRGILKWELEKKKKACYTVTVYQNKETAVFWVIVNNCLLFCRIKHSCLYA